MINLELAAAIVDYRIGSILALSKVYETEAWGLKGQADFLNQALICRTKLNPMALLKEVKAIEQTMGRAKAEHWGPRIIDVDIIFYDDKIIEEPTLKIPHSELTNRNFVLYPLLDICPEKVHPVYHQSVSTLAKACKDDCQVLVYENDKYDSDNDPHYPPI